MAKVVLGATVSVDGFINDRDGNVTVLYPDPAEWLEIELGQESIQNTSAVMMGRNTFDMAEDPDWYVNYEYQIPIFVLTHPPPTKNQKKTAKYLSHL